MKQIISNIGELKQALQGLTDDCPITPLEVKQSTDKSGKVEIGIKDPNIKQVWLSYPEGTFSVSWTKTEIDHNDLLHLVDKKNKLIEYKCINDEDFNFNQHMKLK